jgi:excisionase family DNA binding protein
MTTMALGPAPAPVTDPWLTLQDAAAEAQLNSETLRRAIQRGQLRAIQVNGGKHGRYRLRRSWLDAWLEASQSGGPQMPWFRR